MTDDGDGTSLTPWERETVAWMEKEFDIHEPGPARPRPAGEPGPLLVAGVATAVFGAVVAFVAAAPLDLAGWIVLLVGLTIVWEQL